LLHERALVQRFYLVWNMEWLQLYTVGHNLAVIQLIKITRYVNNMSDRVYFTVFSYQSHSFASIRNQNGETSNQ
jgi:hypothetical protein